MSPFLRLNLIPPLALILALAPALVLVLVLVLAAREHHLRIVGSIGACEDSVEDEPV